MLLAHALRGLVKRAGIEPGKIEDVVTGAVTQAGEQGANIGRLSVLLAGFPVSVPAVTINRMCGSSQQAVHFAAQEVAAGDSKYAIGAGVESMTRVPMFTDIGGGYEKLNPEVLQKHNLIHRGKRAHRWFVESTREEVDQYSAESHRRASSAAARGLNREILPTPGLDAQGKPFELKRDEGIRDQLDMAKMRSLATVFRPNGNGVVTLSNSVDFRRFRRDPGRRPRDGPRGRIQAASPVPRQGGCRRRSDHAADKGDSRHARRHRAGAMTIDLDWIEINEAFATVVPRGPVS